MFVDSVIGKCYVLLPKRDCSDKEIKYVEHSVSVGHHYLRLKEITDFSQYLSELESAIPGPHAKEGRSEEEKINVDIYTPGSAAGAQTASSRQGAGEENEACCTWGPISWDKIPRRDKQRMERMCDCCWNTPIVQDF